MEVQGDHTTASLQLEESIETAAEIKAGMLELQLNEAVAQLTHATAALSAAGVSLAADAPEHVRLTGLTADEVGTVLRALGFEQYAAPLGEQAVKGADLAEAKDADLLEMGVKLGLHRSRLMTILDGFKTDGVPVALLGKGWSRDVVLDD